MTNTIISIVISVVMMGVLDMWRVVLIDGAINLTWLCGWWGVIINMAINIIRVIIQIIDVLS